MTIRQHIKRRLAIGFGVAMLGWLFLLGVMVSSDEAPPVPLIVAGMAIFVGAVLSVQIFLRCPRCKGNLGITIGDAMLGFYPERPVSFCPFCAISLDEEVSTAKAQSDTFR